MAVERTFSMIKPDATAKNLTGKITAKLEEAGLRVVASKRVWMSRRQAEGFYAVHKGRPFFDELCEFMSSGPTWCRCSKARTPSSEPRSDGRDRPGQGRAGHHPQGVRHVDRRELGARLRCAGDGEAGDRLLVLGDRNRRLNLFSRLRFAVILEQGDETMFAASEIKEHMEVVGADGRHVGTVDHMDGTTRSS